LHSSCPGAQLAAAQTRDWGAPPPSLPEDDPSGAAASVDASPDVPSGADPSLPGDPSPADESAVDESVVDESVVDESVVDESVADESAVVASVAEESMPAPSFDMLPSVFESGPDEESEPGVVESTAPLSKDEASLPLSGPPPPPPLHAAPPRATIATTLPKAA
jgi:hypothetical protein